MKKIIDVGYHFIRLEMLIPNMWFITWFLEARAEFRAWQWNLKQKWVMGEWNFASIFLSLMRVSPINLGSESSSSNKLFPHECRSYFVWQLLGGAKIENSYLTKERCWGVDRERERDERVYVLNKREPCSNKLWKIWSDSFILSGRKPFTEMAIPNERPKILLVRFLLSPPEGGRAFPVVCEIPGRHGQARSKLLQTKQLELDYSGLVQHPIRKPTDQ